MNSPRWALVTGASSGLGVEYVRSLARSGHGIVLVARDGDRLQSVAGQVADEFGVSTEVLVADLHNPSDVAKVGQRLGDTRRPVRVLINNAGYGIAGNLAESDFSAERNHLAIHVTTPLELTKAVLPGMLERGGVFGEGFILCE